MEQAGHIDGSSIRRQETFETDPKFASRSKSGGIKKGDLSLPIIGPRHLIKHQSAEDKDNLRSVSPERGIHTDKTYTKSLLGNLQPDDLNKEKKVSYRLKAKKETNSPDIAINQVETDKRSSKKVILLKENRKTDSKSVESGDSSKENKVKDNKPSDYVATEKSKKGDNSIKDNSARDKKTLSTNTVGNVDNKESKIDDKKKLVSGDKTKKTLTNQNEEQSLNKKNTSEKAISQNKTSSQENSGNKATKEKSKESKAKREKLRDKLTSTPVSNFDSDIAIKPGNQNTPHVLIKETKPTTKNPKEDPKRPKEEKQLQTTSEKLPPVKVDPKSKHKLELGRDNLKSENKELKVQTLTKVDQKTDEIKKNRLKHVNNNKSINKESDNNSETINKTEPQQHTATVNVRKLSSDSLESGFASFRPNNDNSKDGKEVEDIISLLSYTETEVSKPPGNTLLERPRSDKSKVGLEEGRPVSNKSKHNKDFVIQTEKAEKSKDYREFEKNRPLSRGLSSEGNKSEKQKSNRRMEPVVQRKPGSERMTESYESIYEERRTLLEAEVAYRKRIKQLEDELNQFLKTIEDLRAENKALRSRIDSLENATRSGSNNESEQLKVTIQSLETQNKALESKHEKTEARLAKVEHEKDKLTSENNELTSKLTDLQGKYSKVDNELAKLKLESFSSSSKDEGGDISKLEKEINRLSTELKNEQAERKKLVNENTILKTDKDVLKDEITALRSINKNLEAINEELKVEHPGTVEFPSKEKMELKSQIIKLQSDNQTLNEENIKLKAENLKQIKSIHDLEKTAKTFESSVTAVESKKITEIQDLQNENAKLKSDIKGMKDKFADAEGKIKTLESSNKDLEDTLSQKKSELSELMSALKDDDKFDTEINLLKKENKRLQDDNEEKDKIVADSKKHLEEIKIEKEKFESEKDKLTKKINEMLEINEDQKKQMAELQEKITLARQEIESNKEKLQQMQKYENEISELKSKLQSTEKDRDRLIKQKQDEIEELKLKIDRNDADSKEKIEALKMEYEKEIEKLKKQVEFLQNEIDELRQLKVVESELLETKDELTQVKEKYSQLVGEIESKSDLEQKNFQMNVRMTQMNNTIKQLERDQKEWLIKKQQIDEIEASNKRLQDENIRLKQRGSMNKVSKQIDKQIEFLERKQKDAETRVKQLEGWVGNLYDEDHHSATYVGSVHSKKPPKRKPFTKAPGPQTTIRIEHDRPRSLDDVVVKEKEKSEKSEKMSHSSSPILPAIEPETRLTFGLGYSQIHRGRIKAAQKYRK